MRWKLAYVGKPSLAYAKQGCEEYLKRLKRYATVETVSVKADGQEAESASLLKATEGTLRICLDERGKSIRTEEWVERIDQWELDGLKSASLILGGADGHTKDLRESCEEVWSLSGLTLQHELALVVVLEGLYRCYTIKRGEPYHRP